MPRLNGFPDSLRRAPFTSQQAIKAGVTPRMLQRSRFRRLFPNSYVVAGTEITFVVWLKAALIVLPIDSVVSHVSALRLYGFACRPEKPFHFSTNSGVATRVRGLVVHRRQGRLTPRSHQGLPVLGPDRTIVDCATILTFVELVQAADHLIQMKPTTFESLWSYAERRHLDGVRRARRTLPYVREGAESPMETLVRLMIVFARLPEPECNRDIFDSSGNFIARGDMPYFRFKVLVEYDGWWHERDGRQRQRDRVRREALEAAGWRVIVVTSEDLKDARLIPWRIFNALKDRGFAGPAPRMNVMWIQWFA
ncbi:MAG: DUF559 domain-containing protein [Aeromicrobium sp.]